MSFLNYLLGTTFGLSLIWVPILHIINKLDTSKQEVLEEKIKLNPSNYLWSHRRWKWTEEAEKYAHLMV